MLVLIWALSSTLLLVLGSWVWDVALSHYYLMVLINIYIVLLVLLLGWLIHCYFYCCG